MNLAQLLECEEKHSVLFSNDNLDDISNYLTLNFTGFGYLDLVRYLDDFVASHDIILDYTAAGVKDQQFHMEWVGVHNSRFDFIIERTLLLRESLRVAVHTLFILPVHLQGRGIAKIILRGFYKQYQASGVDIIELIAGKHIGGYAWAIYGFHATDPQRVLDIIEYGRARLNITFEESELHSKIFHDFYQQNPPDATFPMRDLATSPGGKALLQDTNWNGILDLRNDLQRELFETYLDLSP